MPWIVSASSGRGCSPPTCCTPDGSPAERWNHRFADLRDAAGVAHATPHRLRHQVATFLVARSEILQAQARLGHADEATTLREYAYALPLIDRHAADALDTISTRAPTSRRSGLPGPGPTRVDSRPPTRAARTDRDPGGRLAACVMMRGMTARTSHLSRITVDPAVCHGKPTVRGMRMPVQTLLELLAGGMTLEEVLADYPYLEREDVLAALEFGAAATGGRQQLPGS